MYVWKKKRTYFGTSWTNIEANIEKSASSPLLGRRRNVGAAKCVIVIGMYYYIHVYQRIIIIKYLYYSAEAAHDGWSAAAAVQFVCGVNIFFDGDNIGGGPGRPSRLVKPTQCTHTHTHKTNSVLEQIIRACVCVRARDKHLEGRE